MAPFKAPLTTVGARKKALIKGLDHQAKLLLLFPSPGEVRRYAAFSTHSFFPTMYFTQDRSKAASRVFNQRTDHHIRSHCKWLPVFHKLSVTIVNHTDDIRFDIFDKCDQFPIRSTDSVGRVWYPLERWMVTRGVFHGLHSGFHRNQMNRPAADPPGNK